MAVKDNEIPLFEQIMGTVQSYPFDFSEVIPSGMSITEYGLELDEEGIVEERAEASLLSSRSVLVALEAKAPGEAVATVTARVGDRGIVEALQARIQVRERSAS